jgi:hypothetical protein
MTTESAMAFARLGILVGERRRAAEQALPPRPPRPLDDGILALIAVTEEHERRREARRTLRRR